MSDEQDPLTGEELAAYPLWRIDNQGPHGKARRRPTSARRCAAVTEQALEGVAGPSWRAAEVTRIAGAILYWPVHPDDPPMTTSERQKTRRLIANNLRETAEHFPDRVRVPDQLEFDANSDEPFTGLTLLLFVDSLSAERFTPAQIFAFRSAIRTVCSSVTDPPWMRTAWVTKEMTPQFQREAVAAAEQRDFVDWRTASATVRTFKHIVGIASALYPDRIQTAFKDLVFDPSSRQRFTLADLLAFTHWQVEKGLTTEIDAGRRRIAIQSMLDQTWELGDPAKRFVTPKLIDQIVDDYNDVTELSPATRKTHRNYFLQTVRDARFQFPLRFDESSRPSLHPLNKPKLRLLINQIHLPDRTGAQIKKWRSHAFLHLETAVKAVVPDRNRHTATAIDDAFLQRVNASTICFEAKRSFELLVALGSGQTNFANSGDLVANIDESLTSSMRSIGRGCEQRTSP